MKPSLKLPVPHNHTFRRCDSGRSQDSGGINQTLSGKGKEVTEGRVGKLSVSRLLEKAALAKISSLRCRRGMLGSERLTTALARVTSSVDRGIRVSRGDKAHER